MFKELGERRPRIRARRNALGEYVPARPLGGMDNCRHFRGRQLAESLVEPAVDDDGADIAGMCRGDDRGDRVAEDGEVERVGAEHDDVSPLTRRQ